MVQKQSNKKIEILCKIIFNKIALKSTKTDYSKTEMRIKTMRKYKQNTSKHNGIKENRENIKNERIVHINRQKRRFAQYEI